MPRVNFSSAIFFQSKTRNVFGGCRGWLSSERSRQPSHGFVPFCAHPVVEINNDIEHEMGLGRSKLSRLCLPSCGQNHTSQIAALH